MTYKLNKEKVLGMSYHTFPTEVNLRYLSGTDFIELFFAIHVCGTAHKDGGDEQLISRIKIKGIKPVFGVGISQFNGACKRLTANKDFKEQVIAEVGQLCSKIK